MPPWLLMVKERNFLRTLSADSGTSPEAVPSLPPKEERRHPCSLLRRLDRGMFSVRSSLPRDFIVFTIEPSHR